jgi:luciferase-like monooxygenase
MIGSTMHAGEARRRTMSARERIAEAVTAWPGVTATGPGERGEYSFVLGRHEVGHLHGSRVAHFAFKRELGAELRAQGRVEPHPITDSPSLGARRIESDADVEAVIELMRLNYERLVARYGAPAEARDGARRANTAGSA